MYASSWHRGTRTQIVDGGASTIKINGGVHELSAAAERRSQRTANWTIYKTDGCHLISQCKSQQHVYTLCCREYETVTVSMFSEHVIRHLLNCINGYYLRIDHNRRLIIFGRVVAFNTLTNRCQTMLSYTIKRRVHVFLRSLRPLFCSRTA